ncbi:MAG: YggS family pyridoxal phosphate-dependent enzyme [Lautropia sp.]
MTTLEARYRAVQQRLRQAALAAGRDPGQLRLLAVSKTFPPDAVRALAALGQTAFGENYVQEAQAKIAALEDLPALEWHFIGPIQSNKTGVIARCFDWVHSIEREAIAERLSRQRLDAGLAPLPVCIQVNVSGEASKHGCTPQDARALARAVGALPGLALRGVMAIPEPTPDTEVLRARFAQAARVLDAVRADARASGADAGRLDTLSMGMSADLEPAVAEGATIVRVGSALFGARPARA